MGIGIAAALGGAFVWALSGALIASQTARLDPFSISFIRAVWALLFFVAALFVLGADGDIGRMSAGDLAQLIGAGFIATGLAETIYAVAIPFLGFTRMFTIVTGLNVFFAFVFGAIFLDDPITMEMGIGSVVMLAGVYLVALYGRPRERPAAASVTPGRRFPMAWRRRASALPIAGAGPPPVAEPLPTGHDGSGAPVTKRFPHHRVAIGLALALTMGVMWGAVPVWIRSASEGFDASAVGLVRMPFIVVFLGLVAGLPRGSNLRRWDIPLPSQAALAVSGAVGTGLSTLLIIVSVQHISAGEFHVLFSTAPLFGMLLAVIFLRERVTSWALIGALLVLGGIALIASPAY